MIQPLKTARAVELWQVVWSNLCGALAAVNDGRGQDSRDSIEMARTHVAGSRQNSGDSSDDFLNDLYVVDRCIDFVGSYRTLWEQIENQQFAASWRTLQDCLDDLRLIKRFSGIDLSRFEHQLAQLEQLYPYKIFASIDATVGRVECSICGLDIDSDACAHRRGQLYAGQLAGGIARELVELNSVSLVLDPADKRCVVQYEDVGEQFKLVRFLADLLRANTCRPLGFSHLKFSKRRQPNPEFRSMGRNDACFCGSGRKFKKCCIDRQFIENDHVDIVGAQSFANVRDPPGLPSG